MMPAGDVRGNYNSQGATWTILGASPSFANPPTPRNQVGSTVETYQQGTDTTAASGGSNCSSCHFDLHGASAFGRATVDVSRIFNFPGSAPQPLSFAQLSVRVSQRARHTILVTVTDSGRGGKANVSDPDGSANIASGVTSSLGTAALTYPRCFEVFGPPEVPKPARVLCAM